MSLLQSIGSYTERLIDKPIGQQVISAVARSVAKQTIPERTESNRGMSRDSLIRTPEEMFVVQEDQDTSINQSDIAVYLELYQKLIWIYRCVHEIATSIAQMTFRVVTTSFAGSVSQHKDEWDHPLFEILADPNNLMTTYDLFVRTITYLQLAGNAYWFIERDADGIFPIALHCPRPDRVEVKASKAGGQKTFVRRANGRVVEERTADVVHFAMPNPLSDFWGMPAVMPGQDSAIIDLYLFRFDKAFYNNAIRPSYVLESEDEFSDANFERVKRETRYWHAGVDKWGGIAFFERAKLRQLRNEHHITEEILESRRLTQEELFYNMGCHHLVALAQKANRSTLEMAYRMFWELTVIPLSVSLQQTVTKDLLWRFPAEAGDRKYKFVFDTRQVKALQESLATMSLMDFRYNQTGVQTINEQREMRGFGEPVEWGDGPPPNLNFSRTRTDTNEVREAVEDNFAPSEGDVNKSALERMEFLESLREIVREVIRDEIEDSYANNARN